MNERPVARLVPRGSSVVAGVAERIQAELDALVSSMGSRYQEAIPEYAAMTPAQMSEEVLPTTRRAIQLFFESFLAGREPPPKELRFFEESGRRRLQMGVPLDAVLHAYRLAGRLLWDAIVDSLEPGEETVLAELAARWMDFIDQTSSVVARGYLAASHERLRHLDARRRELVEAILTAADPAEVAAVSLRFSTVLASLYTPVLLQGSDVAVRIDALFAAAPPGTLGGHRGDRVLLLVPDGLEVADLVRSVEHEALVAWGRPAAPGQALLGEVRHVESLVDAAVAEHLVTGAYGPEDLLVEQLLLGNERVSEALRRRVLEPLQRRDPAGVVVATLRCYLATGSVPDTARREVVHANTVSYRLNRVREITGLDPRIPDESALLVLALRLQGGNG